jgi:hypothetical protein
MSGGKPDSDEVDPAEVDPAEVDAPQVGPAGPDPSGLNAAENVLQTGDTETPGR